MERVPGFVAGGYAQRVGALNFFRNLGGKQEEIIGPLSLIIA